MASYSVQTAKHQTLVASTVDDVTLASYGRYIQVLHRGSATNPIYFTVGRTAAATATPTAAGDNTFVAVAGVPVTVPWPIDSPGNAACVKLISAGAESYSVQVVADRLA